MWKWKPDLDAQSGCMNTSWLQWKDANWSGTGTSHDHLDWPRLSYRELFKEGDEEADRGNDGKTTSKSGLALNGTSYYRKPRTARSWLLVTCVLENMLASWGHEKEFSNSHFSKDLLSEDLKTLSFLTVRTVWRRSKFVCWLIAWGTADLFPFLHAEQCEQVSDQSAAGSDGRLWREEPGVRHGGHQHYR